MKYVAGILIAGLLCLQATAQELSSVVIPSEDEIYEAYLAGEIDYDQYLLLVEMEQNGLEPSLLYLLDLIPELSSEEDSVEQTSARPSPKARHTLKYGYYQRLEADERSRYLLKMRSQVDQNWELAVGLRKELTGRERFVGRSATYRSDSGVVRSAQFGTFTRKYGLGSVIGYRGKLLSYSPRLDDESILFPDFGGFNGVALDMCSGNTKINTMGSYSRDEDHTVALVAANLGLKVGRWSPQVTLAATRLGERYSAHAISDYKSALTLEFAHKGGSITGEYCLQGGARDEAASAILDLKQRFGSRTVSLTGWSYGDKYLNLTSGGKASTLSHTVEIEEVDFSFTDRRSGQRGLSGRFSGGLSKSTRFAFSTLAGWRSSDSSIFQIQSQITRSISKRLKFGLEYLTKRIEKQPIDSLYHRVRASVHVSSGMFKLKTYLGETLPESGRDYFSWLADLRLDLSEQTRLQLWSNLSRVLDGRIDYWNLFAKLEHKLNDVISVSTKLSDRYDPNATEQHLPAFSFELNGGI